MPIPAITPFLPGWLTTFGDNQFQYIRERTFRDFATDLDGRFVQLDQLTTNLVRGSVFRVPTIVLENGVVTVPTALIPPRLRILGMEAVAVNGTDPSTAAAGVRADPITFRLVAHSAGTVDALVDEQATTSLTLKARWVRTSGTAAEKAATYLDLPLEDYPLRVGDVYKYTFTNVVPNVTRLFEVRRATTGGQNPLPTGDNNDPNYLPYAPLSGMDLSWSAIPGDPLENVELADLFARKADLIGGRVPFFELPAELAGHEDRLHEIEADLVSAENESEAQWQDIYALQDRLDSTAFGTTADEKNRLAGRIIGNNAGGSRTYAAGAAAMAAATSSLVAGETFSFPLNLKLSYAGVNLVFPAGVKVRGNGCTLALDAGAQFLNGIIFTDNDVEDLHLATHASGFSNVSLLNTRWSGGSLDVPQLYHYASLSSTGNNTLFAGTITNAFDSTAIKRAVLGTKTATYRLTGATSYVSFGPAPGWGSVVLTVQNYTDAAPSAGGATGPWPSFTNPVTDDDANFYRATCEPGFRTVEVESTSNGGLTAQVATESQRLGNVFSLNVGIGPVEVGQVGWRLREGGGRAAGPWLFNTVRFEAPSYVELLPNADFTLPATGDQATGWYLRPGIEMAGDGFARCTNPAENPHLRANVVSALKGNRSYTVRANITNSAGGSFNPQYQFNGQYINLPGFVGNGLHEFTFTTPAGPDDTLANFIFYMNAAGMEIDSVSLTLNP